jgi:hypothetical protein
MKKDWHGILKIEEFKVFEKNELIIEKYNLYNMMHKDGESLILNVLFAGGTVPNYYYLGLDTRTTLIETQKLSDLEFLEPSTNGYQRQQINSKTGFVLSTTAPIKATSVLINFSASAAGTWGPVKNMFLTTAGAGYTGSLISSVPLGIDLVVNPSTVVSIKFSMTLSSC